MFPLGLKSTHDSPLCSVDRIIAKVACLRGVYYSLEFIHSRLQTTDHFVFHRFKPVHTRLFLRDFVVHLDGVGSSVFAGHKHFQLIIEKLTLLVSLLVLPDAFSHSKLVGKFFGPQLLVVCSVQVSLLFLL